MVDFGLMLGKKIKGRIVYRHDPDAPPHGCPLEWLDPLLRKNQDKVYKLANQKISFDFYNSPSEDKFYPANEFLNNFIKIVNIVKLNPNQFPFYYSFVHTKINKNEYHKGSQHLDIPVFINGKEGALICGWDECHLWISEEKKIDLTNRKEIECNEYDVVKPADLKEYFKTGSEESAIVKSGKKVKYIILKESLYEYSKPEIDEMLKFIRFAKKKKYWISTYTA